MVIEIDKNSMLYWYPLIADLDIPQPKTVFVVVSPEYAYPLMDGNNKYDMKKITKKAKEVGYPLFLRTDQMSGKHSWDKTCYVNSEKVLKLNLYGVVESTLCCDVMGRPVRAFFFREYIPMDSGYTAFWGNMPVNPERRYYFENGKVLCHHPYWIEEAINRPSIRNWKQSSRKMNTETDEEIKLLTKYAELVAKKFKGFWSVDFCKAKDGRWILIDMALGKDSWHPEDCPNNRTERVSFI